MTFPNPFETNPVPGLQGVAESIDLDSAAVQRIATALYQRALEPLEQDKRKVAALKGKLVRPVAQSLRAQDSRTLTAMGQRLRQDAAAQVADTDAEIMLLASRLGARQSAGELPAAPTAQLRPSVEAAPLSGPVPLPHGAGALVGVPVTPFGVNVPVGAAGHWECLSAQGGMWTWSVQYPSPHTPPPGGDPRGHPAQYQTGLGHPVWVWLDAGGRPTQCSGYPTGGGTGGGGGGDTQTGGSITGPTGVPCPPCEPCPVGVPPGGTLGADVDACRKPDNTNPQAVYIVPWLGEHVQAASAFSECGKKQIAEAQYPIADAARIAAALSRPFGYVDVVTDLEQLTDPAEAGQSIGLLR